MPFNLVGFVEATPGTGIVPVAPGGNEQMYRVSGDDIYIPKETPHVLGVMYSAISTGARAILRQPKQIDRDFIRSVLQTGIDQSLGYTDLMARALTLRNDKLTVYSVNATDEDTLIGILLGDGKITQAMKDQVDPTHFIHGYADVTITALSWSPVPITWVETLDAGVYEVISMRVGVYLAANLWTALARLSIPGSQTWKPGVVCNMMGADHEEYHSCVKEPWADWSLMGIKFDTDHMPNLEMLSTSAITDENIELGLQKVE